MARAGGTAAIASTPGEGTEVELTMLRREERSVTLRVVLVDDHELFRAGVRGELGAKVEIVGEAGHRRRGGAADPARPTPTSCCSTCTSPTAAARP